MTKKSFLLFILFTFTFSMFSQSLKIKYIKGNISDKASAVKEASGDDNIWLSNQAIDFVLNNKSVLKTDRDLDGLAVAAILSLPADYVSSANDNYKNQISDKLNEIFILFNDSSTVRIAVLSKINLLKDSIPVLNITKNLNSYVAGENLDKVDSSLFKAVSNTLSEIGDSGTFLLYFNLLETSKNKPYQNEIVQTIQNLTPGYIDEAIKIVHCKDPVKISALFNVVKNNPKISKQNLCEIAENVLSETILFNADSSDLIVPLQLDSMVILSSNRWTRASSAALDYFEKAKEEFQAGKLKEEQFVTVIQSLYNISILGAVGPVSKYLGELNTDFEAGKQVSQNVVLAVINSLGAIGDKSAFDSLLAVTYLSYPESITTAARDALAGLKW